MRYRRYNPARRAPRGLGRTVRNGVTVLEVILVMPILVILLMAVVEFGLILANLKQVAVASRVGGEVASQTPNLDTAAVIPADIVTAVERQLASSNVRSITPCRVTLVHNVGGTTVTLKSDDPSGTCPCDSPATPPLPSGTFVRVTVCLPVTELAPNLLGTLGFDTSTKMAQHTTTFQYEL